VTAHLHPSGATRTEIDDRRPDDDIIGGNVNVP